MPNGTLSVHQSFLSLRRAAGIDVRRRNGLLSDKTSVGLGTASVQLVSASKEEMVKHSDEDGLDFGIIKAFEETNLMV